MAFPTDLEIARARATQAAGGDRAEMGCPPTTSSRTGATSWKIGLGAIDELADAPGQVRRGQRDHPTPLGEGKTTTR